MFMTNNTYEMTKTTTDKVINSETTLSCGVCYGFNGLKGLENKHLIISKIIIPQYKSLKFDKIKVQI